MRRRLPGRSASLAALLRSMPTAHGQGYQALARLWADLESRIPPTFEGKPIETASNSKRVVVIHPKLMVSHHSSFCPLANAQDVETCCRTRIFYASQASMFIATDIRNLILDPALKMALRVELDDFFLHTSNGPISLGATVMLETGDRRFRLELRDREGRDLKSFFRSASKYTEADTLRATGVVGGRLRVELMKIWPPTRSTTRPVGSVRFSSASLSFGEIAFPPEELDTKSFDEIKSLLRRSKAEDSLGEASSGSDKPVRHEHFAVFTNTRLRFENGATETRISHGFWGDRTNWATDSWDGKALGGDFSIRQVGRHLEVGFRHDGGSEEDAQTSFRALLKAFAYTHAILPWPSYTESRCDGRLSERSLRAVTQEQGKFFPLRQERGDASDSPARLLAAVAELFGVLSVEETSWLELALWGLRSADSPVASTPVQISMVCAVVEGLRSEFYESCAPPKSFTTLQQEALAWLDSIKEESNCAERTELIGRLKLRIESWEFNSRRIEWESAFIPLFKGKKEWLKGLFKVFNDNRHDPAHGNFRPIAEGDSFEMLDAIGRLAGFINILIAVRAGYSGKLLESPFSDETVDVGAEREELAG